MLVDDLLRRHGLAGPAALLPLQGKATAAWATRDCVIKIPHEPYRDEVLTEVLVAPLALAAGVRTPTLLAWARGPDLAYSVWTRVPGEPLDERSDPSAWRDVGRALSRLHAIEACDDPRGLLDKPDKRNARPWLHRLPTERATFFAAWLDLLDRAGPGPKRLLHYDVHGLNILCPPDGTTLIDWADAAWGDPAADLASAPMHEVPALLEGYEERGSLGPGGEGRIVRAAVGQAVRKLVVAGWSQPMDDLLAFFRDPPPRFRPWRP